ncbi:pirin family protein [Mangrovivirga cuniculi]|uniref:Quercetin 2,3-dioxygenase C-terminal cupin domain-containing protein n=1 Tax=Mangrovivirga cuniculi TaxID=2715131 RepID=A0A4D7JT23_9BACT|nr:hypothetical protein [Mangrovivirga cuniculi]QCK15276.1 hypothetical protein DCC35_11220 [Mangrovivirga cuniculi]
MEIRVIENRLRNKIRHDSFTAWHDYLPSFKNQGSLAMVYKELLWPGAKYQTKHSHEFTIVQCSFSGNKSLRNSYWEANVNSVNSVIHKLYPDKPIDSMNLEDTTPYFGYQFWFNSMSTDKDTANVSFEAENLNPGELKRIYEAKDEKNENFVSLKYGRLDKGENFEYKSRNIKSKIYIHVVSGGFEFSSNDGIIMLNNEDSVEISDIIDINLKFIKDSQILLSKITTFKISISDNNNQIFL